jgi:hypothetical protein
MYKFISVLLLCVLLLCVLVAGVSGGLGYHYGTKHIYRGHLYIHGFMDGCDFGAKTIFKYK